MADHPLDRRRVEEIGRVLQRSVDPVRPVHHPEEEIELRRGRVHRAGREREARRRRGLPGHALEGEHHLEERRSAGVAGGIELLDQPFEGHVLVRVGAEARLSRARDERVEREIRRGAEAQHERVEEGSGDAFDLRTRAVRDRRAHEDVVLGRVAVEEHAERGEQGHERRRPGPSPDGGDRPRELQPERDADARATVRRRGRSRMVGWQIEGDGSAGELRPPGFELGREDVAGEPAPLPRGVVRVLHREIRQAVRALLDDGGVHREELATEDAERPRVDDAVIEGQEQRVIVVAEGQQTSTHERARGEIEGAARLGRGLRRASIAGSGNAGDRVTGRWIASERLDDDWTGRPSAVAKPVRRTSWRRTISASARRRAPASRGPRRRRAVGMTYDGSPGSSWARNQSRSCAKESGEIRAARTGRIGGGALPPRRRRAPPRRARRDRRATGPRRARAAGGPPRRRGATARSPASRGASARRARRSRRARPPPARRGPPRRSRR